MGLGRVYIRVVKEVFMDAAMKVYSRDLRFADVGCMDILGFGFREWGSQFLRCPP